MSELKSCQQCGSPIPQTGELAGRCPHCMLGLFFDSWDGRAEPSESASTGSGDQGPASLSRSGTIGRYRILRLIGEGGMGAVYEAEQDQPRRTVALKIIRPAIASPELLRRFEQESQALGRLQHPGIAQIYEAGTVDTGFGRQPYFAMEFVRGLSPREYAEAHKLTTRDRLEMVAKICDGVHHAHQRGLIHRDLKPGNILVDGTGQPKILDFGVARVTDSDARATLQTDVGQLVGTLAYMSPEQALADPLDIDIRTDVYALGVILYELLSGQLPYPISKKIHETIQTIREQDPIRLGAVNRNYRGDIETIVAKALEKDRARRYASAAEMAADIHRYLNDEPILARPPNTSYQLQKFARRHKALVAGTAAVFVVLAVGIVASTWYAVRFSRERDRAVQAELKATANEKTAQSERERAESETRKTIDANRQTQSALEDSNLQKKRAETEAEIAMAFQEFVASDLLGMADPAARSRWDQSLQGRNSAPATPDVTIKEVLDRAARNIGKRFEKQPLVEAAIRETIAETYFGIARPDIAREHFEKAFALRSRELGPDSVEALRTQVRIAASLYGLRQWEQADALIENILERRPRGPKDNPSMVEAIYLLLRSNVSVLRLPRDRSGRAPVVLKNFISVERKTFGSGTQEMSAAVTALVSLYRNQGPPRYVEMEALLKELHQAQRRELGDGNSSTQSTLLQLISVYMSQVPQRYAQAETLLKDLVDDQRRKLGDVDSATIFTINQLVNLYVSRPEPQVAQAEKFLRPLLEEQRHKLGDSNRATIASMGLLVRVLLNQPQPRYAEAEVLLQSFRNSHIRVSGNGNGAAVSTAYQLADLYFKQGRYLEAEKLLAPIVATETKNKASNRTSPGWQDAAIANSLDRLFQIYKKLGRTQEAEAVAAQLMSFLKTIVTSSFASSSIDENFFGPVFTLANVTTQLWAQGRDKDADEIALTVLEGYRKIAKSNPRSEEIPSLLLSVASTALTAPEKQAKLEKLANDILEIQQQELGENDPATMTTMRQLAGIYADQFRFVEAEETYLRFVSALRNSRGDQHTDTIPKMAGLGVLYATHYRFEKAQGNVEQARRVAANSLPFLKEFLAVERARPGASANVLLISVSLSTANALAGNYAEAERIYSEIMTNEIAIGAPPAQIAGRQSTVALLQALQGNYEIAEATFREACAVVRDVGRTLCLNNYGATLAAQKKFEEAESILLKAYEGRSLGGASMPLALVPLDYSAEAYPGERILKLYEEWGKPEKVAEWRDRLGPDKTRTAQGVRWQVASVPYSPSTFDLEIGPTSVTGLVAANAGMAARAEIYDGKVEGNTISFRISTPDTFRTISFIGKLNGNEIAFTRSVQFRNGGDMLNKPGNPGVFGVAGAMKFVAKRVE